ncbi:hypothetical protein D3C81_1530950 [compost metagenome]
MAIGQHERLPIRPLRVVAAQACELVFDQERHHRAQAYRFLLAVGEAGDLAAGDQRLAVGGACGDQCAGCMADQPQRLVGAVEGFDQCDGIGITRQIPQRAVATRIEHRIELRGVDLLQRQRRRQMLLRGAVLAETLGSRRLRIGRVAVRVQWRLAARWRCQGDLGAGILEHVIRCGEFFQPEPGLAPGVAELVVRSQYEQDFHGSAFNRWGEKDARRYGRRSAGVRWPHAPAATAGGPG